MRLFNGRDGLLAGEDAVDEVARVVRAAIKTHVIGAGFVVEERKGRGFDRSAIDPNGAFGTLEGDSLTDSAGVDEFDSAGVDGFEVEVGGGVPKRLFGPGGLTVFDGDGAGEFGAHAPLGDVGVVTAPVGDLAAGVVEDPAEVDVATAGGKRGGAEPHIVVKRGGDGFGGLAVNGLVGVEGAAGEAAEDGVEFAEAAIADDFAGFAEAGVGALLAAGLEDAVVFGDGGDHGAAFGDREGEGLFAVDILAGAGGLDGGDGVPVVGKGDEDGVDIGRSEDVAEVFVGVQPL